MGVRPTPDGHIHLINPAGRKVWGTDEPPVQLVRDAWQEIPISIEFPDFPKDNAYWLERVEVTGPPFPGIYQYAMSFVKMLPQELTLPDIVLGTVPSDKVNYVDWRLFVNWSKRPSSVISLPVSSPVALGKQVDLRGGSALLEYSLAFSRMIHIRLEGTNIVLSRRQSTSHDQPVNWAPGNATHYSNGGIRPGWTYGSSPYGAIVHMIQAVSRLNGGTRVDSNRASLSDPTNYSSTWTGTLYVKPGRANATI